MAQDVTRKAATGGSGDPGRGRVLIANPGTGASPGSALARLQGRIREGAAPVGAETRTPEPEHPFFDHVAMSQELARRRRRRLRGVLARMTAFVLAPVAATFLWFWQYATPLYSSEAEFVIQKTEAPQQPQMGGMLAAAAMGGAQGQDAIMIQSFLTSRDAMDLLEKDHGFIAHFSAPEIDWLHRLDPNAPREEAYELYEKMVRVGYDPTEGIVRLEVISADPQTSRSHAAALIGYAEERVDSMTVRMREHQMKDAMTGYADAESRLRDAQERVISLQEAHAVMPAEAETGILSGRAGEIEAALSQARLSLVSIERNAAPNQTRVQVARDRVADLERELELVRSEIKAPTAGGMSRAAIQGEIALAQGEVEARLAILGQAAQQLEVARLEAARQMRFVSVSVTPSAPDVAAYPELWKNTGLAFLVFAGLYLAISLAGTVVREQVNQ